jgi:hypothetical protein
MDTANTKTGCWRTLQLYLREKLVISWLLEGLRQHERVCVAYVARECA